MDQQVSNLPESSQLPTLKKLNPKQLQLWLRTFRKVLTVAQVMAKLTPSEIDDVVVADLAWVADLIEPYAGEPWFCELLNYLFSLKDNPVALQALAHSVRPQ